MTEQVDLSIFAASFAGLVCARVAASRGLKVAVIEKKSEPGASVHTTGILVKEAAEALAAIAPQRTTIPPALVRPVPPALVRKVPGVRLYAPSLRSIDLASPGYYFLATDTPGLMRWLAAEAEAAGANLHYGTPFIGAVRQDGRIRLASPAMAARYLIGADGARSMVAEAFGLGRNRRTLVGLEAEYEGLRGVDGGVLHTFLDSAFAPGYLGWAVPGVGGIVQIGLACRRADRPELAAFTEKLRRVFDFSSAKLVARRSGPIPVGGAIAPMHAPGVALVGDSAGLVSPLTAGGIFNAVYFGARAGALVADYLGREGTDPGTATANATEPGAILAAEYPRYRWKSQLRRALDLGPPNWLFDASLGTAPLRALARLVYFHTKGLGSGAAWRDVIRGG